MQRAGDKVRVAAALWWLNCHCRPAVYGPEKQKVNLKEMAAVQASSILHATVRVCVRACVRVRANHICASALNSDAVSELLVDQYLRRNVQNSSFLV